MQAVNFEEVVEKIAAQDPRYHREAYFFLREALDYTQKLHTKKRKAAPDAASSRHVTGRELLDGIRQFALQQYGPMTFALLAEWGLHRCEDFGELVFNMVDHRLLGKTETDTREDFKGGYEFAEAFVQPFQPAAKQGGQPGQNPTPKTQTSK